MLASEHSVGTLIFDRGPVSKNCRSFEMNMLIGAVHY